MPSLNDTEFGRNYAKQWRKEVFGQCTVPTDFFNKVIDQYSPVVWGTTTCAKDIELQYANYLIELQKSMQPPVVNPPADGVYQLDLAALRGYNRERAECFATSDVEIIVAPRWNTTLEALVVVIAGKETGTNGSMASALVPCDWLTPNPAPTFRFIVTAANGNRVSDETVQGIPREYADYTPILLREGFEWVGINYGSQRVSIERVFPPMGEESDSE